MATKDNDEDTGPWGPDYWRAVKSTARRAGVSTRTIRRWITAGLIEASKVGPHCLRVRWGSVQELLRSKAVKS